MRGGIGPSLSIQDQLLQLMEETGFKDTRVQEIVEGIDPLTKEKIKGYRFIKPTRPLPDRPVAGVADVKGYAPFVSSSKNLQDQNELILRLSEALEKTDPKKAKQFRNLVIGEMADDLMHRMNLRNITDLTARGAVQAIGDAVDIQGSLVKRKGMPSVDEKKLFGKGIVDHLEEFDIDHDTFQSELKKLIKASQEGRFELPPKALEAIEAEDVSRKIPFDQETREKLQNIENNQLKRLTEQLPDAAKAGRIGTPSQVLPEPDIPGGGRTVGKDVLIFTNKQRGKTITISPIRTRQTSRQKAKRNLAIPARRQGKITSQEMERTFGKKAGFAPSSPKLDKTTKWRVTVTEGDKIIHRSTVDTKGRAALTKRIGGLGYTPRTVGGKPVGSKLLSRAEDAADTAAYQEQEKARLKGQTRARMRKKYPPGTLAAKPSSHPIATLTKGNEVIRFFSMKGGKIGMRRSRIQGHGVLPKSPKAKAAWGMEEPKPSSDVVSKSTLKDKFRGVPFGTDARTFSEATNSRISPKAEASVMSRDAFKKLLLSLSKGGDVAGFKLISSRFPIARALSGIEKLVK